MNLLFAFLPKIEHLGHWSYWLVFIISVLESTAFIGLIIPGTTAVIFTGFLASQHVIDIGDSIWFVAIGGIIGDAISFNLGHRSALSTWIKKRLRLSEKHLDRSKLFFRDHGNKSILLARFIGPLRPIVPFIAGASHMPRKTFFIYNIIGSIAAACFYLTVGYFFGVSWHWYHQIVRHLTGGLIIVLITLFIGYVLNKKLLKS